MDYIFGEYTTKKNISPLITNIDDETSSIDSSKTVFNKTIKKILLTIIKLFIFINISWTIIATSIIDNDKSNILFQILYSIGYVVLVLYIKKNKVSVVHDPFEDEGFFLYIFSRGIPF